MPLSDDLEQQVTRRLKDCRYTLDYWRKSAGQLLPSACDEEGDALAEALREAERRAQLLKGRLLEHELEQTRRETARNVARLRKENER